MKRYASKYALLTMMSLICCHTTAIAGKIQATRHNLSISGPGSVTAASEDQICVFCHTPHSARSDIPYLWNRSDRTASYFPYQSSTLVAAVGQPTGSSKQCLSCHDGTIALGALKSSPGEIPFKGGIRFMPEQAGKLGTDLSDDHPISFVYHSGLALPGNQLADPATLPAAVNLDDAGQLQCTSCHDPHDNTFGSFLVMSNQYSNLCTVCHNRDGWTESRHALSNAQWNGMGTDPWPGTDYGTVAENGCRNCHRPHGAGMPERLLNYGFEEDNCMICHNGNVSALDVESQFVKLYTHPVGDYSGRHDAAEDFTSGAVPKHVECEDCHNPHKSTDEATPGPPAVSGANSGVSGIGIGGQPVDSALYLYEICFKCHADNNVISSLPVTRRIDQLNTRREFDAGNPSLHPVGSAGANPDVPSLVSPYTTNSLIFCTDCHNTDALSGANGPHGSAYRYLLEKNYETEDYTFESAFSYALCYKCHSRSILMDGKSLNSGFSEHYEHTVERNTPCSACHDPHGISGLQGNAVNNSHLINFDTTIAQPDAQGRLYFEDLGHRSGRCFLTCHGKAHDENNTYPPP